MRTKADAPVDKKYIVATEAAAAAAAAKAKRNERNENNLFLLKQDAHRSVIGKWL